MSNADMLRVHMDSAAHLLKECLRLQNENEQLRALLGRALYYTEGCLNWYDDDLRDVGAQSKTLGVLPQVPDDVPPLTAIISRKIEDLDKARALLALLAQGEVISFSDSIGDPVYFCSHCDPGSNEHEPVCPILQAKTLGIEVTE